ncbi:MFS transporter [Gandjariella thermophila]|uniref:MFS transporter n=1 Tax=Gandjariella thermophila TaxID=1931992 RepID=A0A4D4JEI4_9PSEU|nr:MFS transporter [Gandjariella thermophila]GDY32749.1 MFS transporter [Gandjariella thermophila]
MTATEAGSVAGGPAARNPWQVFGLLAAVQFIVVLDTSVVYIALPSIQRQLGFSEAGLAWVMDAYMLGFGGFLLLGGRAADLLGRRRVLITGMVLFILASLVCGLSSAAWLLVAARAAQGLTAAVISPAAMALVTEVFEEGPDRYKALGMFGGIGGLAGALGVLIGGLLTSIGWQWAFLINVPVMALVLLFVLRMVPKGGPRSGGRVDLFGATVGTGGLCALLYAVVRGGSQGWGATATLVAFGVAVVLLAAFVVRQLRAATPLVPRALFRLRNVVLGNVANAATGALMFGLFFVVTLYLQHVRGFAPLTAAVAMMPISVALFVGSQVTIRQFGRVSPVTALAGGLVLQGAGLLWWALVLGTDSGIVTAFVLPGIVFGFGVGAAIVGAFVSCTTGVHGAAQGAASGLVSTTLQIGGAVGVAGLGTVASRRTASVLAEGTNPLGALASGHAWAMGAAALLAAAAVPVVLWLRASWRPPAMAHHHGPEDHRADPVAH